MSEPLNERHEFVFLYDIKYGNPNGDPMGDNMPRIDDETQLNIVTDVRLKRTIRDYLMDYKGQNIFVKKEYTEGGTELKTREDKLKEEGIKSRDDAKKLLAKFIDLRVFGATIAGKKDKDSSKGEDEEEKTDNDKRGKGSNVFTWIGPVQFRFGRSLHQVKNELIEGTTVLPSKEKKAMGTFTQYYVLPYSLICFYGIANEVEAKETGMTKGDLELLLDGIWNGTKSLITRSKFGQMPRLLMDISYKEKYYYIGDLDSLIKKESDKNDVEIRDISELKIVLDNLIDAIKVNSNKIGEIRVAVDRQASFKIKEKTFNGEEVIAGLRESLPEIQNINKLEL
ncbi:MAG: type I-B CRISPR-associated protein Cas7/Csh2 [Candidatus Bathyarchaeia archaeon]